MEYDKAIANGVPGDKILFNGPDKTDDDLILAIQNDSPIHIDHLDELYRLTELATAMNKKPRVAIRVNMDIGVYPMWDRFGFNYENGQAWDAINKIMAADKLNLVGLHTHIGTYMLTPSGRPRHWYPAEIQQDDPIHRYGWWLRFKKYLERELPPGYRRGA
jgi:diaminopimelate decarboxylase